MCMNLLSRKTYSYTIANIADYCTRMKFKDWFPLKERILGYWCSMRVRLDGIALTTLDTNLAHIASFHIDFGIVGWSCSKEAMPQLRRAITGWRQTYGYKTPDNRWPWLIPYFHTWLDGVGVDLKSYRQVLYFTWTLVCFFTCARSGEILADSQRNPDIWKTCKSEWLTFFDHYAIIRLPSSKTHLFGASADLLIPELRGFPLCPIWWMKKLTALRASIGGKMAFDRSPYLFVTENGRPLTKNIMKRELEKVIVSLDLDWADFGLHSLRIGSATELFRRGRTADEIKKLGRWVGDSYSVYERLDEDFMADMAKSFMKPPMVNEGFVFRLAPDPSTRKKR